MSTKIRKELLDEIQNHLRPYLEKCHRFYFQGDNDLIELDVKEAEEDISERVVIRVGIIDSTTQLHIPNISFPISWRGKGDGMKLIDVVYRVAKRHNYALFITYLTDGFYRYLLSRGALRTDADTVEIVDSTQLMHLDSPNGGIEKIQPQVESKKQEQQPEDKIWNAITESAKTRFEYNQFEQTFSELDDPNIADNILFIIISGYAVGHSNEEIAENIKTQLLMIGFGFQGNDLERLVTEKEAQLKTEIRATAVALELLERGAKLPGVLVQIRHILSNP